LRVSGRPNLENLDLFERGWFEIQDAGSQRIVDFCQPRRGQLVVDFCAGAGGKTLAIAARMRNVGKVLAFDTGEERLSRLAPRARRAGADIVDTVRIDGVADARLGRYRRRADLVLVDAPCSGTGTLRRSPDMKWRLSPARLSQHVREQQEILAAASSLVRAGGKLVYATCSLLQEENEAQAEQFREPGFELLETRSWLPDEGPSSGFFAAKWLLQARE
jgi:16S rRNA (cytosine967-C5)-methyltransferase